MLVTLSTFSSKLAHIKSFKYWQRQNYYSMKPISNAIFYSAAVYKTVELY
jgi:hypothetical protein